MMVFSMSRLQPSGNLLFDLVYTFETARLPGGDGPSETGHETALLVQV